MTRMAWRDELWPTLAILGVVGLRLLHADQPIVENYVGRQIPTAMVAANLLQGSGFLRPSLSTEPAPNLFLVEPPIYAWTVAVTEPLARGRLEARGRILSALATGLGAWGLYGLVIRRQGRAVALLSVLAFGSFPVMIRYGRAFQPDALMLGLAVAGMRLLDDFAVSGRKRSGLGAWICVATAMALKIISVYLLVPMVIGILRPPRRRMALVMIASLVPALVWYLHAATLLDEGSRASADNAGLWGRSLGLAPLLRLDTWTTSLWYVGVKSFTPLGFVLASWGLLAAPGRDRLWIVWLGSVLAAFVVLSGKIHHEYYWIALAPVLAVGVGLAIVSVRPKVLRIALMIALAAMGLYQSRSTWTTPREWAALPFAARAIREVISDPSRSVLVAREAVLFASRRPGFRLEVEPSARARAAGEFGAIIGEDPLALVEFYRSRGARYVADLVSEGDEPRRRLLHEAIRRRYNVRVDRDGVLIAELIENTSR